MEYVGSGMHGSMIYSKSPTHKENNTIITGGFNLMEASKTMDTRYILKQKNEGPK